MNLHTVSLRSVWAVALVVSVLPAGCSGEDGGEQTEGESAGSALQSTYSLWDTTAVPKVTADPDTAAVEIGTKFRVDVAGKVSGVRFYKASNNTGTHTGHLWRNDGKLLASVTFTRETASGWQTATFASPVTIVPGTTYVISYHTDVGHYAADNGYFANRSVDRGPLHGLADGNDGGNGVYRYGATGFPTNSWKQTNYWVDVLFAPDATAPAPSDGGAPPPPPPPPVDAGTSSGDPCATFPALPSVRPTEATTGVPKGTVLTPSGTITVTTPGTVIDGKDVKGTIFVNANNVTIKNTRVTLDGGYYGIRVDNNVTGTKILHSEIATPAGGAGGYTGIAVTNGIVCACNIHGWENGMTVGGGMFVQANYVHGLASPSAQDAHFDAVEVYSGSNTKVWGNNLLDNDPNGNWIERTSALFISSAYSNVDNVEARGNWLGGGSYTLYVRLSGAGPSYRYSNITIRDNRWIRGSANYGPHSIGPDPVVWSNNVWDDNGQPIAQ